MVKISIIMPVYNDETKLEKSIGSVMNQTLTDLELICVDDGSTDNSLKVLQNYAEKDNRIKVFSQKNQGSGSARNNGISRASGEYIAFLDSDDFVVDKNAYYLLYTEAKKKNVDMACGSMQFINGDKITYEFKTFKPIEKLNLKNVEDYGVLWYFYKNIFRREFLINNNIKFPDLRRGQDPVFLSECLSRLEYFLEVPVIYYAYNAPSESKLNNSIKYHDYFLHFYEVFEILTPHKRFANIISEYAKILIQMKNREVLVYNKNELMNLLDIMNNIKKLFVEMGNNNLSHEVVKSFNVIVQNIHINNIHISFKMPYYLKDMYTESVIVKDTSFKPHISLLMHVYNIEEKLPQCLESLVNQTFDDFEIICIDDGSTDNSLNILKIYEKNDFRIKVFSFTHKGENESINRAIYRANGDYVLIIDAQNKFELDFCEKIWKYNKKHLDSLKKNYKPQNTNKTDKLEKIKELEYLNEKYQEYLQIKDGQIQMMAKNVNMKNHAKKLETNVNKLNKQVHNQEKELIDKDFKIKQLEDKLNTNQIEFKYIKDNNKMIKHIFYPLSYIYLILKSPLFEIIINIKLFRRLINSPYFDVGVYFSKYPELTNTFCCKYFSPQLHYVCFGFNEKRQINKNYLSCSSKNTLYNQINSK